MWSEHLVRQCQGGRKGREDKGVKQEKEERTRRGRRRRRGSVRRRGEIRWRASVGGGTLAEEGGVEGASAEQVIKTKIGRSWGLFCFFWYKSNNFVWSSQIREGVKSEGVGIRFKKFQKIVSKKDFFPDNSLTLWLKASQMLERGQEFVPKLSVFPQPHQPRYDWASFRNHGTGPVFCC